MKTFIILLILFISTASFAGKEAVTPSALLLNSDKVELISAEFLWGAVPADTFCRVTYRILNNDRTTIIREIVFNIAAADFTALISGFGSTLESRLESSIWTDIQNKFDLVLP